MARRATIAQGNDQWTGTVALPDAARTDGPFRSLQRARDAVRERFRAQEAPTNLVVILRGGTYALEQTVVFSAKDSSPGKLHVTYRNYPGETPVLSSGVPITGWRKLQQSPVGLPAVSTGKVWVADVPADLGRFRTLYDGPTSLPRACGKGFSPTQPGDYSTLHFPPGARQIRPEFCAKVLANPFLSCISWFPSFQFE